MPYFLVPSPASSPLWLDFFQRIQSCFASSVPFREDLDQEEKAKFGEYCSSENGKGREWFARYVSAQVRGGVGRRRGVWHIPATSAAPTLEKRVTGNNPAEKLVELT